MFSSPTNIGFNGFLSPMAQSPFGFRAPIPGPHLGGLPLEWQPVVSPPPAHQPQVAPALDNFLRQHPDAVRVPNRVPNPPRPAPVFLQGASEVQADLGYQQPNRVPAPVLNPALSESYIARQLAPLNISPSNPIGQAFAGSIRDHGVNVVDHLPSGQANTSRGGPSYQGAQSQPQGHLDSDETQRKNLYSISYFDSVAQNASPQIDNRPSNTSIIFHEYRSASLGDKVSPADFIANYYGNGDSNSVGSPLVKICKMELTTPITIGSCVIDGRRNYIDINDGGNKTRIHIDDEGAKDLENYRILVRGYFEQYKGMINLNLLSQDEFKNLKSVNEFNDFFVSHARQQTSAGQAAGLITGEKALDAFADTFISNNLKLGIFKTEIPNSQGGFDDKPFAYVKIERPINDKNKINVTVSDKHSAELNSININAGKNSKNEEVFFQLSVKQEGEKQVIAQDSLKYFTKNGNGEFEPEGDVKKSWFGRLKSIGKLGDAIDKTINIYTHKEKEEDETLKYVIKGGKFVEGYMGYTYDSKLPEVHKHQKVKCGEPNDFNDHEFINGQSRSASPQAGARVGPQSPDQVAGGVGGAPTRPPQSLTPVQHTMAPALMMRGGRQAPMMVAPMSPHPSQIPVGHRHSGWHSDAYLQQSPIMMMGGEPPPLETGIWNMRPPTPSEVRRRGLNPNLPIAVRPGDRLVAHDGAVRVRVLPPILRMSEPQSSCHPSEGRPMQQWQGPGRFQGCA